MERWSLCGVRGGARLFCRRRVVFCRRHPRASPAKMIHFIELLLPPGVMHYVALAASAPTHSHQKETALPGPFSLNSSSHWRLHSSSRLSNFRDLSQQRWRISSEYAPWLYSVLGGHQVHCLCHCAKQWYCRPSGLGWRLPA